MIRWWTRDNVWVFFLGKIWEQLCAFISLPLGLFLLVHDRIIFAAIAPTTTTKNDMRSWYVDLLNWLESRSSDRDYDNWGHVLLQVFNCTSLLSFVPVLAPIHTFISSLISFVPFLAPIHTFISHHFRTYKIWILVYSITIMSHLFIQNMVMCTNVEYNWVVNSPFINAPNLKHFLSLISTTFNHETMHICAQIRCPNDHNDFKLSHYHK